MSLVFSIHLDSCLSQHRGRSRRGGNEWDARLPEQPPKHDCFRDWGDTSGRTSKAKVRTRRNAKKGQKKQSLTESFAEFTCVSTSDLKSHTKESIQFDHFPDGDREGLTKAVAPIAEIDLNADPMAALRATIAAMVKPQGWTDHAKPLTRDACLGAIEFLEAAFEENPGLSTPDVSPSRRGGVTLSWWLGDIGFLIRVSTRRGKIYFQQEGPDFRVETGMEPRGTVLQRLAGLAVPGKMS